MKPRLRPKCHPIPYIVHYQGAVVKRSATHREWGPIRGTVPVDCRRVPDSWNYPHQCNSLSSAQRERNTKTWILPQLWQAQLTFLQSPQKQTNIKGVSQTAPLGPTGLLSKGVHCKGYTVPLEHTLKHSHWPPKTTLYRVSPTILQQSTVCTRMRRWYIHVCKLLNSWYLSIDSWRVELTNASWV
jgi:hypothetical protein